VYYNVNIQHCVLQCKHSILVFGEANIASC